MAKSKPIYTLPPITPQELDAWRERLQSKMRLLGFAIDHRREQALRKKAFKRMVK